MGRGRLSLVAVSLVAAAVFAAAGTGQAKPRHAGMEVRPADASGYVLLGKRGGYDIDLYLPDKRVAILYVSSFEEAGGSVAGATSGYAVHTKEPLTGGVVRAGLGPLGRVSLRFRPNGRIRRHHLERGCKGRPAVTEYGRFVGHVSFDGEGGYLRASFNSGRGEITRSYRLVCNQPRAYGSGPQSLREYAMPNIGFSYPPPSIALLYAAARDHGRSIWIRAAHQEGSPPGAEVQVGSLESDGGMAIGRSAHVDGFPGTLLTSLPGVHPATATLAPPAPFYGEANYLEKSPTSHGWTGTLGVDLPGLTLPLTGSGFYTSLCVVGLKVRKGCDFIKPKPLEPDRSRPDLRRLFR